jgi:ParB family chromosome partitioning protein
MPQSTPAARDQPETADEAAHGLAYVRLADIQPNPYQPRQEMDPAALEGLAQSIRQDGLMQPVVLRPLPGEAGYQLVAGERRWRAAELAGLDQIPAVIRELDDQQLAEWAVIENLQREDLDAIERAEAFRRLVDQFSLSHEQVADRVGVQRSTVSNSLRLLDLSDTIRSALRAGKLSGGHARALLGLSDVDARERLAQRAIAGGWSVRMVEAAVRRATESPDSTGTPKPSASRPAHLDDLEEQIGSQLGTKVAIKTTRKKGRGAITIQFYSLDQFDGLLERLGVELQ